MADGIRTPNVPLGIQLGEFLGHEIVGGQRSVKRFSRANVIGPLESAIGAGGGVVFASKAMADANLVYPTNQMAWVVTDTNPAYNGIYQKLGSSGSG